MHQYKIIYTDYSAEGAPTTNKHYTYADSAETAQTKYEELNKVYSATEEGKLFKAYKVEVQVSVYKSLEDPASFFAQFRA